MLFYIFGVVLHILSLYLPILIHRMLECQAVAMVTTSDVLSSSRQMEKHTLTNLILILPYIAVCCGQDPVFVNQGPATEVLARGALNGHDVSDGVRCRGVSAHDTALYHILT